jgi:hypothetical protein
VGGIPIGRIAGFAVSVNWSVLVILWLFTWRLAGVTVFEVTLWLFGGVTRLGGEAKTPNEGPSRLRGR